MSLAMHHQHLIRICWIQKHPKVQYQQPDPRNSPQNTVTLSRSNPFSHSTKLKDIMKKGYQYYKILDNHLLQLWLILMKKRWICAISWNGQSQASHGLSVTSKVSAGLHASLYSETTFSVFVHNHQHQFQPEKYNVALWML